MIFERNDLIPGIARGISWSASHPYALIFLIGVIITFPVIMAGLPLGSHDGVTNAFYADNFANQVFLGEFYPRWLYLTNGGLGSPTFFSYQPLPSYIALFFKVLPISTLHQLGLVSSLAVILSGVAAYLWLKEISTPVSALLGATFFMLLPYPGFDLYVRGAYGEGITFVWMPLIMYFAVRISRGSRMAGVGLAFCYALLCLTHLPVTVMFSGIPLLYTLLISRRGRRLIHFAYCAGGMLLGAGIAAIYLIPVGAYQSYAYLHELREGHFHYSFWLLTTQFNGAAVFYWMPFIVVIAGFAAFLFAFANMHSRRHELIFWMVVLAACLFMLFKISTPVWAAFTTLQAIQFPFRFNAIMSVAVLPLFALAIAPVRNPIRLHSLIVIAVFLLFGLYLAADLRKVASGSFLTPGDGELAAHERMQRLQLETKGRWPRTVPFEEIDLEKNLEKIPTQNGERARAFVTSGTGTVNVTKWRPRKIELEIDAPTEATVNVSQFYFPGWNARIAGSGSELPVSPSKDLGLVTFSAAGKRVVNVTLDKLWPEYLAEWISGISLLMTMCLGFLIYRRGSGDSLSGEEVETGIDDMIPAEPPFSPSRTYETDDPRMESPESSWSRIRRYFTPLFNDLYGFCLRHRLVVGVLGVVLIYGLWISNLSTHPGGFFVDESCQAYNSYLIGTTGTSENGTRFPLFYQCYTGMHTQWMSPTLMYLMAGMFAIISPSLLAAHIYAATVVFLGVLLLGFLAFRISGRRSVGLIVFGIALLTPWIFEISRLVHEVVWQAFTVALFLFCLHRTYSRAKWTASDYLSVGTSLALITYAYAAGRVIAPLFALGLLLFGTNRRALTGIIKTWIVYGLMLIPFFMVYLTNPQAVTARFGQVSKLSWNNSIFENLTAVLTVLSADLSLKFLLYDGDQNSRHHLASGMGEFLVAGFALSVLGLIIVLVRHRADPWWRFVLFGTVASLMPGALTEPNHALRGIAFPIFIVTLSIPGVSWLLGDGRVPPAEGEPSNQSRYGRALLFSLLFLILVQAAMFQARYVDKGDERNFPFEHEYPEILAKALAETDRPIYLEDDPTYIHAYWYAATQGIDASNFVHLRQNEQPPDGSLVITRRESCSDCQKIDRKGDFMLYRKIRPEPAPSMP